MRINVVPVELLADAHLRAEYREILMAPHFYHKCDKPYVGFDRSLISKRYTLNKGHAYMWFDKMGYIMKRHFKLEDEMIKRGFKVREEDRLTPKLLGVPQRDMNDFIPTKEDMQVNVERIMERMHQMTYDKGKPDFYKMNGKNVSLDYWTKLYDNMLRRF